MKGKLRRALGFILAALFVATVLGTAWAVDEVTGTQQDVRTSSTKVISPGSFDGFHITKGAENAASLVVKLGAPMYLYFTDNRSRFEAARYIFSTGNHTWIEQIAEVNTTYSFDIPTETPEVWVICYNPGTSGGDLTIELVIHGLAPSTSLVIASAMLLVLFTLVSLFRRSYTRAKKKVQEVPDLGKYLETRFVEDCLLVSSAAFVVLSFLTTSALLNFVSSFVVIMSLALSFYPYFIPHELEDEGTRAKFKTIMLLDVLASLLGIFLFSYALQFLLFFAKSEVFEISSYLPYMAWGLVLLLGFVISPFVSSPSLSEIIVPFLKGERRHEFNYQMVQAYTNMILTIVLISFVLGGAQFISSAIFLLTVLHMTGLLPGVSRGEVKAEGSKGLVNRLRELKRRRTETEQNLWGTILSPKNIDRAGALGVTTLISVSVYAFSTIFTATSLQLFNFTTTESLFLRLWTIPVALLLYNWLRAESSIGVSMSAMASSLILLSLDPLFISSNALDYWAVVALVVGGIVLFQPFLEGIIQWYNGNFESQTLLSLYFILPKLTFLVVSILSLVSLHKMSIEKSDVGGLVPFFAVLVTLVLAFVYFAMRTLERLLFKNWAEAYYLFTGSGDPLREYAKRARVWRFTPLRNNRYWMEPEKHFEELTKRSSQP